MKGRAINTIQCEGCQWLHHARAKILVNVRTTATPDRTKSTLRRKDESSDNCLLDSTSQ